MRLGTRPVSLFARHLRFGTRRFEFGTRRTAFWTPRMRSNLAAETNRNLPPLLATPKLCPARANQAQPGLQSRIKTNPRVPLGPCVPSFAYMGGPGREGFGPADFLVCFDRYCRPCRVPAHPHRWVAPHSTRGKTMDQPTQAVPIPRGHRPANCCYTCIAQRPPSGGAR